MALKRNTLWRIAKLYDMTLEEIMKVNGFTSELIFVNQPIIVLLKYKKLSEEYYRVSEGDTRLSISNKFSLPKGNIDDLNKMKGYSLRKGMILKIK